MRTDEERITKKKLGKKHLKARFFREVLKTFLQSMKSSDSFSVKFSFFYYYT